MHRLRCLFVCSCDRSIQTAGRERALKFVAFVCRDFSRGQLPQVVNCSMLDYWSGYICSYWLTPRQSTYNVSRENFKTAKMVLQHSLCVFHTSSISSSSVSASPRSQPSDPLSIIRSICSELPKTCSLILEDLTFIITACKTIPNKSLCGISALSL